MDQIMEECRNKFNFGGNLNDSLDYQEYNEEESCKLNQNRDNIY